MTLKTRRGVFPMHLTPFEAFMYMNDHPRFPMTFVVRFAFSGDLVQDAFQSAVDRALQRHPMLRALIRPAKASRDCWVQAEDYDSEIDFGSMDDPIQVVGASEYIDLKNEIGFRGFVRKDENRAIFYAVFHHSAVDGIGAYQFLGDVLWFYADQFGASVGELSDYCESDLRKRLRANIGQIPAWQLSTQREYETNDYQKLSPRNEGDGLLGMNHPFPAIQVHEFNRQQYRELRLDAQKRNQTVNDRLLEALFTTMLRWNEVDGSGSGKEFCVLMPLDLRTTDQVNFSAANLVTSSFIHRSPSQIQDQENLASSLIKETVQLKHSRHESEFMTTLFSVPSRWTEAHSMFEEEKCHATAVLSNAGDPTKRFQNEFSKKAGKLIAGNLVLEEVGGASPLRNSTRLTVNIFTYQRKLSINLRMDPQFFTASDSQGFLKQYVDTFLGGSVNHSPVVIAEN
ncbi:MAG: hypothetical protein AAF623_12010 [Planctomycetota bacterium]